MEACGASKVNQESFMSQELFKYSSCYAFKNFICQCWPAFINPVLDFQLCKVRLSVDDPLNHCIKTEENNPARCELCMTGTKLYQGPENAQNSSQSRCVYTDGPGQYLPLSTCSLYDGKGANGQDKSCHACHCHGDCDPDCNSMAGLCTDVCDVCAGEQEELEKDLGVTDWDLDPVKKGICYCPSGDSYAVGV
jgi:hypothetical protein